MENCVFCGNSITEEKYLAKAHTREFGVCCEQCKNSTEIYIEKDKKYKLAMFFMILLGGIGFVLSIVLGKGETQMMMAYCGQIVAGLAFALFPYPIISFESFFTTSIKKTMLISRIVGVFFIVWGTILLMHM
ncbi:MAG: TRASH domain-containing protein [Bacillota bacterium]